MTTASTKTLFHIVASDLDGTLLAPNHQLSDYTKHTLKQLHQQGYTFVFATGRHHVDVAGIREQAGIPAYMITSNGARVHDQNDQLMFSDNVPSELVQAIINMVKQDPDIQVHIYRNEEWLMSQEDELLRNFHKDSGFSYSLFDIDHAPTEGVAKVFFTHPAQDHEHLVQYEDQLNAEFGERLNVAFSTPWCLEVMAANVSKGHALQVVAESLGHTLDNCIAFGDGMNDVEMLSMAGKGLVMGTSHIKVKQALPDNLVIGANTDDAVAHYLADHLLD